jgi:hypothetical protein
MWSSIIKSKYFALLIIVLVGYLSVFFWGDENPVEEVSEYVIKEETGLSIDLTPKSIEHVKNK